MNVFTVGSCLRQKVHWSVMFILTLLQSRTHVDIVQNVLQGRNNSRHICSSHTMKVIGWFLPRCMECRRGLAMRILSVSPSVCQTRELWLNERKISADFYTARKIIEPSFLRKRMVGGGATPSTWNFVSTGPSWSEIADFEAIFARSALAITPNENKSSVNTNRKCTTRFPMSLFPVNLRWSSTYHQL